MIPKPKPVAPPIDNYEVAHTLKRQARYTEDFDKADRYMQKAFELERGEQYEHRH